MKTGDQIIRERGIIPVGDQITEQEFIDAGLPMVVECTGCTMTMAFPTSHIDDNGQIYCSDCVLGLEPVQNKSDTDLTVLDEYERAQLKHDIERMLSDSKSVNHYDLEEVGRIFVSKRVDICKLALYGLRYLEKTLKELEQLND